MSNSRVILPVYSCPWECEGAYALAESHVRMHGHDVYLALMVTAIADLSPVVAAGPAAVSASCSLQCLDRACLPSLV